MLIKYTISECSDEPAYPHGLVTAVRVIEHTRYACSVLGSPLNNNNNKIINYGSKKNNTRPLVFASGCRASENFNISSEN